MNCGRTAHLGHGRLRRIRLPHRRHSRHRGLELAWRTQICCRHFNCTDTTCNATADGHVQDCDVTPNKGIPRLVGLANGAYTGGGMKMVPSADIGDGQADAIVLQPTGALRLIWLLINVFAGTHVCNKVSIRPQPDACELINRQLWYRRRVIHCQRRRHSCHETANNSIV